MLVPPAMKRLFCLMKEKNALGRFAPSALPHYYDKFRVADSVCPKAPWQLDRKKYSCCCYYYREP